MIVIIRATGITFFAIVEFTFLCVKSSSWNLHRVDYNLTLSQLINIVTSCYFWLNCRHFWVRRSEWWRGRWGWWGGRGCRICIWRWTRCRWQHYWGWPFLYIFCLWSFILIHQQNFYVLLIELAEVVYWLSSVLTAFIASALLFEH